MSRPQANTFHFHPPNTQVGGTQLFVVLSASFGRAEEQTAAETLAAVLAVLTPAVCSPDDLVYWDFLCFDASNPAARDGAYRLFTYYRVQTIVLDKIRSSENGCSLYELLQPMAYLALATFCQRIVNARGAQLRPQRAPRPCVDGRLP